MLLLLFNNSQKQIIIIQIITKLDKRKSTSGLQLADGITMSGKGALICRFFARYATSSPGVGEANYFDKVTSEDLSFLERVVQFQ